MPGKKYPFIIPNTDRSDKNEMPKKELFYYSFGIDGMKHFIVQDNKKAVEKVLKGIELANWKDDKMTLIKLKFSMNRYYNLTANETAQNLFHLIFCFRKNEKITNFVNVSMPEDLLQIKHCHLWSISNIFLRKFILSQQWQ